MYRRQWHSVGLILLVLALFAGAQQTYAALPTTNGAAATSVIGQPNFTTDTSNTTNSTLSSPASVAYDSVNNKLYVADKDNSRVLRFGVSSITNGMAAEAVFGQPDFISSNTAATATTPDTSGESLPATSMPFAWFVLTGLLILAIGIFLRWTNHR